MLLVYVDDLLMALNSGRMIQTVKKLLSSEFEMTELGEPTWLLGVKITRDKNRGTLRLSQRQYIVDVLKRFRMDESHPAPTPLTVGLKLDKAPPIESLQPEQRTEINSIPYKQAVGSLMYLSCLTRPDLTFVVHLVPQHMAAYEEISNRSYHFLPDCFNPYIPLFNLHTSLSLFLTMCPSGCDM